MKGYIAFSFLICLSVASGESAPAELDVRLVRTSDMSDLSSITRAGRVEVFHNDQWGTVCDTGFGKEEGDVVCKQLGYASGCYSYVHRSMYSADGLPGPIWLSGLRCAGTEAKLTDCPANSLGENDGCGQRQEACVICKGKRSAKREELEEWEEYYMREQLREAGDFYQLKEADDLQQLREADELQQLKEADDLQQLKEADDLQQLKEADDLQQLREADELQQLKEAEALKVKDEDLIQSLKDKDTDMEKREMLTHVLAELMARLKTMT